jgi:hypothetical protein
MIPYIIIVAIIFSWAFAILFRGNSHLDQMINKFLFDSYGWESQVYQGYREFSYFVVQITGIYYPLAIWINGALISASLYSIFKSNPCPDSKIKSKKS